MTTYFTPRELARAKRTRTDRVYQAIHSGRLHAIKAQGSSNSVRFLIPRITGERWQPVSKERSHV